MKQQRFYLQNSYGATLQVFETLKAAEARGKELQAKHPVTSYQIKDRKGQVVKCLPRTASTATRN